MRVAVALVTVIAVALVILAVGGLVRHVILYGIDGTATCAPTVSV